MAHYGLLLKQGWFSKSLAAGVLSFIGFHQLAKRYYDIPTYRDFNLTNWSYALERENLRRQGINPDTVNFSGGDE
ncbi:hypothetical protein BESB_000500 [Besnoitia besnoiti]|uniref:Uncharacterized protein n=1 Tax=Besnoitia besnoiti TaxID=94643 RepID=A0A2A9MGR1_BESBE|nr:hypothetical protein BESB_000500 [Besnoitia besnoiti]PFH37708.1 hypothetical protein BESB_000500 [Besnoitia besnoiti]